MPFATSTDFTLSADSVEDGEPLGRKLSRAVSSPALRVGISDGESSVATNEPWPSSLNTRPLSMPTNSFFDAT